MSGTAGLYPKVNGDELWAKDVNYLRIYKKSYTSASTFTAFGDTNVQEKDLSFGFTMPTNAGIILFISFSVDSLDNTNGSHSGLAGLKLQGKNMGIKIIQKVFNTNDANAIESYSFRFAGTTAVCLKSYSNPADMYLDTGNLSLTDERVTASLLMQSTTPTGTASLINPTFNIIYAPIWNDDG